MKREDNKFSSKENIKLAERKVSPLTGNVTKCDMVNCKIQAYYNCPGKAIDDFCCWGLTIGDKYWMDFVEECYTNEGSKQ